MEKIGLIIILFCSAIWVIKYIIKERNMIREHKKFMKNLENYDKNLKK